MLTSYRVKCPHLGCNWTGSLLPSGDTRAFSGALPSTNLVVFQCPQCQGQWRARVVGDDVKPLPLDEIAMPWR